MSAQAKDREGVEKEPMGQHPTVDISETGMLLKFTEECAPGQFMELILHSSESFDQGNPA
jgi:hypothetical protein